MHSRLEQISHGTRSQWATHKLLLLVRHQLGHLVLAGSQLLLVVHKVAHNELALAGMQLKLLGNLLEERHVEQAVVGVLLDELRRAGHDHVGDLLVVGQPVISHDPVREVMINIISL